MEPVQTVDDRYCIQCGQYLRPENACEKSEHDKFVLRLESSVSEDSLSSLIVSLFAGYGDRPCLGLPVSDSIGWKWLSYAALKIHVIACIQCLQDRDGAFEFLVVAAENSLDIIAFDLAATLLGVCSVIAQGKDHARTLVAVLGEEKCRVVNRSPSSTPTPNFLDGMLWNGDDKQALFSLFATSGSVGNPKLVRRTRFSWLETVSDTVQFSNQLCVTLNFTSLAHSASRTELWWNLACGGQTALADRQLKLLDSFTNLSPTEIAAPPAVWAEIRDELKSRGILDFATLKCEAERLLRNLHTISTGSAPCEVGLFSFLRSMFGHDGSISVFNHYGATEIGSIALDGQVNQDLKVKLLEIPEQGILSPQGELCIYMGSESSSSMFEGYYLEDHCKEAMTDDGYYRTGDIAERVERMTSDSDVSWEIRIIGRVSSMVKLSDGKFESLDAMDMKIQQALQALAPSIKQVCTLQICGVLVAVVSGVHTPTDLPWQKVCGVPCLFSEEPFNVKNGMLTPSLKLCRRGVLAKHEHALRKLIESQAIHSNQLNDPSVDKVTQLLAAITPNGDDLNFDESRNLSDFGVTSIHFARIASMLNIPVFLLAKTTTLRDLRTITGDGGVKAAEADIEFCLNQLGQQPLRQLSPFPREPETHKEWKAVVVTGATGKLGSCFVDLLARRGLKVILVAKSLGHDIRKPQFGMSNEDYSHCIKADAVIHCAAMVNWNAAYSDLRETNVLSIVNLVKLCTEGRLKTLLFVGSGITFPEEPPLLSWLQECANPYMVSKIASELLIRKLHTQTVVVRAGMVVWHSRTGDHSPSDAYVRLLLSVKRDSLVWQEDDFMDGMNVDTFCAAACSLLEHGTFDTYNLCGTYNLSNVLRYFQPPPTKVPYAEWYQRLLESCANDDHPLTALLPHVALECPPFMASRESGEVEEYLSAKSRRILGPLAEELVKVSGYSAFIPALARNHLFAPAEEKGSSTEAWTTRNTNRNTTTLPAQKIAPVNKGISYWQRGEPWRTQSGLRMSITQCTDPRWNEHSVFHEHMGGLIESMCRMCKLPPPQHALREKLFEVQRLGQKLRSQYWRKEAWKPLCHVAHGDLARPRQDSNFSPSSVLLDAFGSSWLFNWGTGVPWTAWSAAGWRRLNHVVQPCQRHLTVIAGDCMGHW
eukprot:Skav210382  [mRNA]  locus=scaffold1526:201719:214762:+ [translate_table: standard]